MFTCFISVVNSDITVTNNLIYVRLLDGATGHKSRSLKSHEDPLSRAFEKDCILTKILFFFSEKKKGKRRRSSTMKEPSTIQATPPSNQGTMMSLMFTYLSTIRLSTHTCWEKDQRLVSMKTGTATSLSLDTLTPKCHQSPMMMEIKTWRVLLVHLDSRLIRVVRFRTDPQVTPSPWRMTRFSKQPQSKEESSSNGCSRSQRKQTEPTNWIQLSDFHLLNFVIFILWHLYDWLLISLESF